MERERPLPPEFSDHAPLACEPDEGPLLGTDSELVFADASPSGPDEGEPSLLDSDSGIALAGIAPGAEQELADAIARDAAQQGARRLADQEREAARKPPAPRVSQPATVVGTAAGARGQAVCPACEAKNSAEATRCGRCGEEIPAVGPGAAGPRKGREGYATHRERLGEAGDAARWDALPERKQREFDQRRASLEARQQAHVEWVRAYRRRCLISASLSFAGAGLVISLVSLPAAPASVALVFDVVVAAAAAAFTLAGRGGTLRGAASFGAAAVGSSALKLAVGGIATSVGMGLGLVFSVAWVCAGCTGGYLFGASVESTFLDQEAG